MFFGSAMTNFGVRPFLDAFLDLAPTPTSRATDRGPRPPTEDKFSGFVFKIQANMDPAHRDRIAFVRVVSGRYVKGMSVQHVRLGKQVKLANPSQFMAAERTAIEEAWPGDVIGLFDPGLYRIGDTLVDGESFRFEGVPASPGALRGGAEQGPTAAQAGGEGAGAAERGRDHPDLPAAPDGDARPDRRCGGGAAVRGAPVPHRARVRRGHRPRPAALCPRPLGGGEKFEPRSFDWEGTARRCRIATGYPLVLFRDDWALEHAREKHPELKFLSEAPQLEQAGTAVASQPGGNEEAFAELLRKG